MIPVSSDSRALALIKQMGWTYTPSGSDQACIETCPLCQNTNNKFYMNISGGATDGMHDCKVCGVTGNIYQLKEKLGISSRNTVSMQDTALAAQTPAPMLDFALCSKRLLTDESYGDVLDYLFTRGFTVEALGALQIGAENKDGKKWVVIPYFDAAGKAVYYKCRSVPPAEKAFRSPKGREAPLYNAAIIKPDMEELLMTEGEGDVISLVSQGYKTVVGVPGANTKKAAWIELLDRVAPKTIYLLYDRDKVGQNAAREIAARIGLDRVKNILLPDFGGKDINEYFMAGYTLQDFEQLKADAKPFNVQGVQSVGDVLQELREDIEGRGADNPTYDSPWPSLNKRLGGIEPGDVVGIMAEGKVGKAQSLDSLLLTPSGWARMGDLKLGQALSSDDGKPSVVTGIFPQGLLQEYLITFKDGRSVKCSADHLWKVGQSGNFSRDGYRVVTTNELVTLKSKGEWFVPLFCGEFGTECDLPIDPWLLGALLGDGGFTSALKFSKQDPILLLELSRKVAQYDCELVKVSEDSDDYRIVGKVRHTNILLDRLESLGLRGKHSINKFVPDLYMNASKTVRLQLLRGLMDTDGSVEGQYNVPVFNTSSAQLMQAVQYLVRSLGGSANATPRDSHYTYKGKILEGCTAFRVFVKLHDKMFVHSHKAAKEVTRTRDYRLTVTSIEPLGLVEMQCISVSHPSKLYITDDFVVTHNTTLALNWLDYFAIKGIPSFMFCQEMPPKRMVRKWVSCVTKTDDTPGRSQITPDTINLALEIAVNRPGDLLFGYTNSNKAEDVFETIRQAVRRYGVKIVCFDNFHMLINNVTHSAQQAGALSKAFKAIAMALQIAILLIIQPNRVQEGQIIAARNAKDSSSIEKDVDGMLCLHRNRIGKIKESEFYGYMDTEENFEPQLLVRVDLSRYAPGGTCTLYMDGATSTVRELSQNDMVPTTSVKGGPIPIENVVEA